MVLQRKLGYFAPHKIANIRDFHRRLWNSGLVPQKKGW